MAQRKTADQAGPGDKFEPYEFMVTPELNQQYLFAVEDFHIRYIRETPEGPPIVHPALLLNQSNTTRSPSYTLPPGVGGIHATDEVQFINPGRVGKKFLATYKVVEVYKKQNRTYQVRDTLVTDEDGLEIMRRRSRITFAQKSAE